MDVFKGLLAVGSVVEKILLNIRRSLMHRNSEAVTLQRLPDFLQRKAVQHRLAELGGDLRQMPDAFRGALTEGRFIRKIKAIWFPGAEIRPIFPMVCSKTGSVR